MAAQFSISARHRVADDAACGRRVGCDRARYGSCPAGLRLGDNLARTALPRIIQGDVMKWSPPAPVSAILLDAPCSAAGIFARHPDVLHRVRRQDIEALAAVQAAMIAARGDLACGRWDAYMPPVRSNLKGEGQMAAASAAGLTLKPIAPERLPPGITPTPEGWLRILPHDHADGFFIVQYSKS